jgi:hypothetical protein
MSDVRTTSRHEWAPLRAVVMELRADYPEWCFAVSQRFDGPRLEARRMHSSSGLYALITADPAELRRELDSASSRVVAS